MNDFITVDPMELEENFLKKIKLEWALLTAAKPDGTVNTMTISWGEFGHFWNEFVVTVGVRPQRYTKEFMDASDSFSVSFLCPAHRKELAYLGEASGRDEDKIKKSGLTLTSYESIPFFEEATLAVFCKTLYSQELSETGFRNNQILEKMYPEKDLHTLYIGAIQEVLLQS